jgi:hypothetical protein
MSPSPPKLASLDSDHNAAKSILVRQGNSRKRQRQTNSNTPINMTKSPSFQLVQPAMTTQTQTPKDLELEITKARLEELRKTQREFEAKQGEAVLVPADPTKPPKSSEDVQMALKRAREKLQGAMQRRDRAMQRLSPVNESITPISALSADLAIADVAATGSEEKVFFPTTEMSADFGRSDLEQSGRAADDKVSSSLAARKLRLQRELQTLKAKLEKHQKYEENPSAQENHGNIAKLPYTKEELEKKKEEAQTVMDISHWKLFVSKQERMTEEASSRVLENRRALSVCEEEQQQTTAQLEKTKNELRDLENSEQAVPSLISSITCKLLQTRKELYKEKRKGTA